MQMIAGSWLVMRVSHDPSSIFILAACRSLPLILLGPAMGVAVDMSNRKKVAIAADIFLGCVTCSIPALWWLNRLSVWHIYVATFLMTAGRDFWIALSRSLVREWVPQSILLEANSTVSMSNQIGVLAGALLGGAIIVVSSEAGAMFVNGMTFFVSAICLSLTSGGNSAAAVQVGAASAPAREKRAAGRFWRNLREGAQFCATHRGIRLMYLAFLVFFVRLPLANALLPLYAKLVLHGNAATFAVLDAATGVGGLVSGFFLPGLCRLLGERFTIVAGALAMSASLVCFGLSRRFWISLMLNFCIGFIFHIWVLFLTVIQRDLPIEFQGRVHSFFDLLVQVAAVACFAVIGWLSPAPISRLYILYGCIAFPLILFLILRSGMFLRAPEAEHAIP